MFAPQEEMKGAITSNSGVLCESNQYILYLLLVGLRSNNSPAEVQRLKKDLFTTKVVRIYALCG